MGLRAWQCFSSCEVPWGMGWAPTTSGEFQVPGQLSLQLKRPPPPVPRCCPLVGIPSAAPQHSLFYLPAQVTLSYGVFEGKLNVIKLQGPFSPEEDPSRWV